MCGLAGIYETRSERSIDEALLARMTDRLIHRGPDAGGTFSAPGIGLGHRRLSIIDIQGGAQPMREPETGLSLVFNGEIYNFRRLRAELEDKGARFETDCDTEVLLKAWREWGAACLDRIEGMFAFAVYDERAKTLHLVRDRLGKKPLYYAELPDGELIFASELKALLVHPRLPREIDAQAVECYFAYGYIPDPLSIYRHVRRLEPGHIYTARRDAPPRCTPYWQISPVEREQVEVGRESPAEELVARLDTAVEDRLIADVPLGAFLSGGVDSSAVVARMAGKTAGAARTFSIGFGENAYDESVYAEMVARQYSTDHRRKRVSAEAAHLVERLAGVYDEPFGDSSALPTYQICESAREEVTVALSGDGGDEVFAGYRRYPWHLREEAWRTRLPAGLRKVVFGGLSALYPKMDWAPRFLRARQTFGELAAGSLEGYFMNAAAMGDGDRRALLSDDLVLELGGFHAIEPLERAWKDAPGTDPLARAQYADLKTWLAGGILVKVDRASMAHGLEVRSPMLDHHFVSWGISLPQQMKINRGETKYLLKKALEPFLPPDVLYRPKQGFSIPLDEWFRGPLREQIEARLLSRSLLESGFIKPNTVRQLLKQHLSGRRDHGRVLWLLMMFQLFLERHENGHPA